MQIGLHFLKSYVKEKVSCNKDRWRNEIEHWRSLRTNDARQDQQRMHFETFRSFESLDEAATQILRTCMEDDINYKIVELWNGSGHCHLEELHTYG